MKSFKTIFKSFFIITWFFSGLPIMSMQKSVQKQDWLKKAQEAQIASPLKVRIMNHILTNLPNTDEIFVNKDQNKWTEIPGHFGAEDISFDMDKPSQYIIRTKLNNIYVFRLEKADNGFKGLLEKLEAPASDLKNLDNENVLNLIAESPRSPVALIDQVKPGTVLSIVLDNDSANITNNEREQLNLGKMGKAWFDHAKDPVTGRVSDPLKMRIVNHTGNLITTLQQGRGNLWWAQVDPNYIFEDIYFNLVNLDKNPSYKETLLERHKGAPQYTIHTDKNLYTINFIKNGAYFKALLERIEGIATHPKATNPPSPEALRELLNLAKNNAKTLVQSIEPVKSGDVMTVTLDEEEKAEMNLNE